MSNENNSASNSGAANQADLINQTAQNITDSHLGSNEDSEASEQNTQENQSSKKAPAAQKKEEKKRLKKLKLKVDNHEYEEELPFEIDDDPKTIEYMTRQLQLGKMGQKRAQEKAELEQEVYKFVQELKANPRKALSDPNIGIDLKKFAQEIIEAEIENMKKSPEQLDKERLELELKSAQDKMKKQEDEFRNRELQRLEEQEFERYDMLVSTAIEEAKLPKNPYVVKKMADLLLVGLQEGINVQPSQVANIVKDEMMADLRELIAALPEEAVEEFIGKDVLNKIRKKRVASTKGTPPTPLNKSIKDSGRNASDKTKGDSDKKQTFKDFFGI